MKNKIVKNEIFNSNFNDVIQDITHEMEEFLKDKQEREFIDMIFAVADGKWQTYNDYINTIQLKKYTLVLNEMLFYYIKAQYSYRKEK